MKLSTPAELRRRIRENWPLLFKWMEEKNWKPAWGEHGFEVRLDQHAAPLIRITVHSVIIDGRMDKIIFEEAEAIAQLRAYQS